MAEPQLGQTQIPTSTSNTFGDRLRGLANKASAAASNVYTNPVGAIQKLRGVAPTEPQYNEISSQLKQLVNKDFSDVFQKMSKEDAIKELFTDRLLIEAVLEVSQQRLVYLNKSFSKDQEKIKGVEINIEYAKIIKKNIDEILKREAPEFFDKNGVLKPPIQTQSPSSISYNPFTDPQMVMLMQSIDTKALIEGLGHMAKLGLVAVGHLASAALTNRGGKKLHKRSRRSTKKLNKRKSKTHKRKGKSRKNKNSKSRKNK